MKQLNGVILIFLMISLQFCGGAEKSKITNNAIDTKALADSMQVGKGDEKTTEKFKVDEEKLRIILEGYFGKYAEKEFNTLKDYYTPEVEQFIRLENIKREMISKTTNNFFKGKDEIAFTPDFSRLNITEQRKEQFTIELPLQMQWQYEQILSLQETDTSVRKYLYQYKAKVLLEMIFDQKYKIRVYNEKEILADKYKTKSAVEAQSANNPESKINIKEGVILTDGLETRQVMRELETGEQVLMQRKIKYKGNFYWITDGVKEAGNTNTNLYLEKVENE